MLNGSKLELSASRLIPDLALYFSQKELKQNERVLFYLALLEIIGPYRTPSAYYDLYP